MTAAGEEWQEWLEHQTEYLSGTEEAAFWERAMAKLKELTEKYGLGEKAKPHDDRATST